MMWQLKYQDAIEDAKKDGRLEGREEGITEAILSSIKSLMETMGISVEKAMAVLKIPEAEQRKYTDLLAKQWLPLYGMFSVSAKFFGSNLGVVVVERYRSYRGRFNVIPPNWCENSYDFSQFYAAIS